MMNRSRSFLLSLLLFAAALGLATFFLMNRNKDTPQPVDLTLPVREPAALVGDIAPFPWDIFDLELTGEEFRADPLDALCYADHQTLASLLEEEGGLLAGKEGNWTLAAFDHQGIPPLTPSLPALSAALEVEGYTVVGRMYRLLGGALSSSQVLVPSDWDIYDAFTYFKSCASDFARHTPAFGSMREEAPDAYLGRQTTYLAGSGGSAVLAHEVYDLGTANGSDYYAIHAFTSAAPADGGETESLSLTISSSGAKVSYDFAPSLLSEESLPCTARLSLMGAGGRQLFEWARPMARSQLSFHRPGESSASWTLKPLEPVIPYTFEATGRLVFLAGTPCTFTSSLQTQFSAQEALPCTVTISYPA